VLAARGDVVVDSKVEVAVNESTERRSIRRRIVVVYSSLTSREVLRPPLAAISPQELSSDRPRRPRVILYTFSFKEDHLRATSSDQPLNLSSVDSPRSPGGSVVSGAQGMSCRCVGDTTYRC